MGADDVPEERLEAAAKDGLERLQANDRNLIQLNLTARHLSGKLFAELMEGLEKSKHLKYLILDDNTLESSEFVKLAKYIASNPPLIGINLDNTGLDAVALRILSQAFASNKILQVLSICGNGIQDPKCLTEELLHSNIVELDLSWNNIAPSHMVQIAEDFKNSKTLKYLKLSHCGVSDFAMPAFAEILKCNDVLESLDLSENDIASEGAAVIADALQLNDSLKTLNMDGNALDAAAVTLIESALRVNRTVRRLSLSGNPVNDENLLHVVEDHLAQNTPPTPRKKAYFPRTPSEEQQAASDCTIL